MAFIFADDPSSLANQRLATDRTNIDIAQADRQARQKAIDDYQQRYIFAQRQAEEDQRQQANQDYQFASLAANQAANNRAEATDNFRFNLGRTDKAAADAESKRRFDIGTDLQNKQFDFTKSQSGNREADNQLKELVGMFKADAVPSDADVTKLFPSLTPEQKDYAKQVAQQQKAYDDQQTKSIAEQASHYVRSMGAVTAAVPNSNTFWFSNAKPAKTITEDEAFKHLAGDKELRAHANELIWDDVGQKFIPKTGTITSGTGVFSRMIQPPAVPASPPVPLPAAGAAPVQPPNPVTPDELKSAKRVGSREEARRVMGISILPDGTVVRNNIIQTSAAPSTEDVAANRGRIQNASPENPFSISPAPPVSREKGTGSPFSNVQYMDQQLQKLMAQRQALLPQVQAYAASNPGGGGGSGSIAGNLSYLDDQINKLLSDRARTLALIDPSIRNQLPPNPAPPAPFAPSVPWGHQFQFGTPGR